MRTRLFRRSVVAVAALVAAIAGGATVGPSNSLTRVCINPEKRVMRLRSFDPTDERRKEGVSGPEEMWLQRVGEVQCDEVNGQEWQPSPW
jgi:hypothetical protein